MARFAARIPTHFLIWAVVLLLPLAAAAGELEFSGSIGVENRAFFQSPQFDKQFDGVQTSLEVRPEISYDSEDRRHLFNFLGFGRLDSRDDHRTKVDIREAYWRYVGDDWESLIGVNTVFWGVTESRHLVNIINQVDAIEDIDLEDYLGQPMINLAAELDWGRIEGFVLPTFRERTFPSSDGRLRSGLTVDDDAAQYEADMGREHIDFALRYSGFFGDWDVGLHYFYGTSREPRFTVNNAGNRLVPNYDLIHQGGLDLQYTQDAWLWKLESIVRDGYEGADAFFAMVGGFEYTFFQAFETNADLGVLVEYLHDGRDERETPPAIGDDDIFLATRLTLNDVQDSQALVGAIIDVEDQSTVFSIEAERRIGAQWKVEFDTRLFINTDDGDPFDNFRDDDFAMLRLSYFW